MTQSRIQEQEELKHYGILGMHWGVRGARTISVGGHVGVVTGRGIGTRLNTKPTAEDIKTATTRGMTPHSARVVDLKNAINAKNKKSRDTYWDKQMEAERKFVDGIAAMEKQKVSEIDSGPGSKISKWLKKQKLDSQITNQWAVGLNTTANAITASQQIKDSVKKTKIKAAQQKLLDNYGKQADQIYEKQVKGLKFPKNIVLALKVDRELSQRLTEDMLKEELKYS